MSSSEDKEKQIEREIEQKEREQEGEEQFRNEEQIKISEENLFKNLTEKNEDWTLYQTKTKFEELKHILKTAIVLSTSFIFQNFISFLPLFFLGNKNSEVMAAAALGITYINVTCCSVAIGILSGFSTLASQALGAGNFKRVGTLLQRAILINLTLMFFVAFFCFASEPLLILLQQDPKIADLTSNFVKWVFPGVFFLLVYETIKRYYQVKNNIFIPTVITALATVINFSLLYIFVNVFHQGLEAAGGCLAYTWYFLFVAIIFYFLTFDRNGILLFKWSFDAFKGWPEYLKLGLPGAAMICFEWWAFEILTFLAGKLGIEELAAHGILINTLSFCYMLPLGYHVTCVVRIGNLLGAGEADQAKRSSYISIGIVFINQVIISVILLSLKSVWGSFFSNDPIVVDAIDTILPLLCLTTIFDGTQAVLSAILHGCAKQKVGALINTISYYFVALPVGGLLAFRFEYGLFGLWLGVVSGPVVANTLSTIYILCFLDFNQAAKQAIEVSTNKQNIVIEDNDINFDNDTTDNLELNLNEKINENENENEIEMQELEVDNLLLSDDENN
eukprot:TRINITY_DN580_c1_g3_i3.p1 TRINITY_DN580_c1_g3~~TRINITY_DN580_c1_g3_i3.p1  ORF type:complete len:562 (-),score=201.80 TRINITY_DN580_c1_g3_i3:1271-2956(-)